MGIRTLLLAACFLSTLGFSAEFHLNDLRQIAASSRSIPEILSKLPRDMRSRFVVMEKSRSAQEGTPTNPRVILYSQAGSFSVTFNGDPSQRGYEVLEILQYDVQQKRYSMWELSFGEDGKAHLSDPNPSACLVCHQHNPRPNWDAYPYWPGTLGFTYRFSPAEWSRLGNFAQRAAGNPRYKYLDFKTHMRVFKSETPAFALNRLFSRQLAEHAPVQLMRMPEYRYFRYAVAGAIADCPDYENFVPLAALDPMPHLLMPNVLADVQRRFQRLPLIYQRLLRPSILGTTVKMRYLLENIGLPLTELSHSYTEKYLLSATGTVFPYWLAQLFSADPELKKFRLPIAALRDYFSLTPFPSKPEYKVQYDQFCSELRQASQKVPYPDLP